MISMKKIIQLKITILNDDGHPYVEMERETKGDVTMQHLGLVLLELEKVKREIIKDYENIKPVMEGERD